MIRSLKSLALGFAILGMAIPQGLFAGTPVQKTSDVRIAGGVLAGRVVTTAGVPAATTVAVYQGKVEVARAQSDVNGIYRVQNLRPGNYVVATPASVDNVRLWEGAAPAKALNTLTITEDQTVRGQLGGGSLLGVGIGAGAVAAVTAAVVITGSDDDTADTPMPATP